MVDGQGHGARVLRVEDSFENDDQSFPLDSVPSGLKLRSQTEGGGRSVPASHSVHLSESFSMRERKGLAQAVLMSSPGQLL